jgi:hypothetical protein
VGWVSSPDSTRKEPSSEQPVTKPARSSPIVTDESPEESRAGDVLVAAALRRISFNVKHPIGQMVVKQLQQAGAGSLIKLWISHDLFLRCRRLGINGLPAPPLKWPSEARSLLAAAATEAAPDFVTKSLHILSARKVPTGQ